MKRAALLVVLALGACRKPAPPPAAPPPAGYATYEREKPAISLHLPESWKILEDQGGTQLVSVFGPVGGARPFAHSLSLYYHPVGGTYASVEEYARAQELAGTRKMTSTRRTWKGREILELMVFRQAPRRLHTTEMETRRERFALIPAKQGFFLMLASSPEGEAARLDETYAQALESLSLPQ